MSEGRLCVEVLGPIRVIDEAGRDVTPDGPLQRRLLAALAAMASQTGEVMSTLDATTYAAAVSEESFVDACAVLGGAQQAGHRSLTHG